MPMKYLSFLIIFLLLQKILNNVVKDKECSLLSSKHFGHSNVGDFLLNKTTLKEFKNFDDLDELNLECSIEIELFGLVFIPNKEIFLDNTFSYSKLFNYLKFKYHNREICFVRIK